jgi:hypothetical protein
MSRLIPLTLALALCACSPTGDLLRQPLPLEQIQSSTFPMSQDVWRVSVRSNGRVDRELVDRAALYRAAELTIARGYQRFVVQQATVGPAQRTLTQTLTQTGEVAGVATNLAVPGAGGLVAGGAGAVVGGLDRVFTEYGGDILIKMYREGDPAGANALDAVEILNSVVNQLRRNR